MVARRLVISLCLGILSTVAGCAVPPPPTVAPPPAVAPPAMPPLDGPPAVAPLPYAHPPLASEHL
jgi:hypothetical protein